MGDVTRGHWPAHVPRHMNIPATDLGRNLEISAQRCGDKPAIIYYDSVLSYRELAEQAALVGGWLARHGVARGDRVLLDMQNSPQFVIGFYAILRIGAVVVPVNPMSRCNELAHFVRDSGARLALAGQESLGELAPLVGSGLDRVIVATYCDYVTDARRPGLPEVVSAPCGTLPGPAFTPWRAVLAAGLRPSPVSIAPGDLALLPYTSGTTGEPKGVMHTHRSAQATVMSSVQWFATTQDAVCLSTLPLFHVTGMQHCMNSLVFAGGAMVILTRWEREEAARCIELHRVDRWVAIPTMLIDFIATPGLDRYDLGSLKVLFGGGAAMPEAVARQLEAVGLSYIEGYGLTETISQTHLNPVHRPKRQCLGIPVQDTEALVIDPHSLAPRPTGEVGEIVVRGPQVFLGYWNQPDATRSAFVDIDGTTWFRTGDLGYVDEDGYFFMVDRLKRMINAAGFKVWPAEVEAILYRHPAVHEACVVAVPDDRRGEAVRAVIVLRESCRASLGSADIIKWSRTQMAAYKVPRQVRFVESLPKSASGKILWRIVQEQEAGIGA